MAHILTAVTGSSIDLVPIKRALISVSDKTGIIEFCQYLSSQNIELLSTGGTAKALRDAGLTVIDVSDYTGDVECLDGRVKTLHPKIHGGLLAVRGNTKHENEMLQNNILPIDLTIVNLYPFEQTMNNPDNNFEMCIENIDIGGPSMLRSTAKNHAYTTIITSPNQYKLIENIMKLNNGCTTLLIRKQLASIAFALSASYDSMIATYFAKQIEELAIVDDSLSSTTTIPPVVTCVYQPEYKLKYGCNPHQNPSQILSKLNNKLPFHIINGTPGYINLLDACNAYQLVNELHIATGLVAAASFKHVSPAGAAVAVPLSDIECIAYEINDTLRSTLTPVSLAYLRARNADPMCSYGDFCAVSDIVDEATAKFLKIEVSDGIIAPGYTDAALEILKKKKGGKFILLQGNKDYNPGDIEYREVYGMTFSQKRNNILLTNDNISSNIVTNNKELNNDIIRDLLVATICIKYTQSNSVGFSKNGMMVGVGAGQQSRIDCVKLAGNKVNIWYLRQHPKVISLPFKDNIKRQDRINARVRYIEGDFTIEEKIRWNENFNTIPEPLTLDEKTEFLKTCNGISISSDAFFPFRDSIDFASKYGVNYVVQPGGSVQDNDVINACNTYGMIMSFTNIRLFHH